jgi:hypothetical protein
MRLRVQPTLLVAASCAVAFLVLLLASVPDAATPKRITGKLSGSGYTVIALAANGKARSVRAPRRSFKLVPPAPTVTLHLRGSNGRYAGPIVVSGKGSRVVVGVKAGANLGTIKLRAGYARVMKRLPKRSVDARRFARARKGVPIGAGRFGRVVSRNPSGAVALGLDRDLDGIPNALDIDDDGDLVLDNFERSATAPAARPAGDLWLSQTAEPPSSTFTSLALSLHDTMNAHAGSLTDEQIDAVLSTRGMLSVFKLPGDSRELDCGALVYCSRGGTGRLWRGGGAVDGRTGERFPECCDPDGDGFGTFVETQNPAFFFLSHGATTSQIRTGDVLIERVTTGGVESEYPVTLQGVIATVPALVSYSDGQGNSLTVPYPVRFYNPYPVKAGPDGNVVLTLTFWRPQRRPIPPETAEWIDIGGLTYMVGPPCFQTTGCLPHNCPPDAFSTADSNLRPASLPSFVGGGLADSAADQAASPANTLTYSVNLTRCLAVNGRSWDPGQSFGFRFIGTNHKVTGLITDLVQQNVEFRRE